MNKGGVTSAAEGGQVRLVEEPNVSSIFTLFPRAPMHVAFLRMQLATLFLAFQRLFDSLVHYKCHRESKSIPKAKEQSQDTSCHL